MTEFTTLREKIAHETAARKLRYAQYAEAFSAAHRAGLKAGIACIPTPMIVGEPINFFSNTIDYTKHIYLCEGGVCGFAWVKIRPANGSFAKWLIKEGKIYGKRASWDGGVDISCQEFGQSLERKEAYCRAFVIALSEMLPDVKAYVRSRID